jgi:hypothetical protein
LEILIDLEAKEGSVAQEVCVVQVVALEEVVEGSHDDK